MDVSAFFASFSSSAVSDEKMGPKIIQFNGDVINSFPVALTMASSSEIKLLPTPGQHQVGSAHLKITNIVNFGWAHQYYGGQLVAVHKAGTYFAYGIVPPGKAAGVVRVMNRKTDERILLKGMKGAVKDLSFAHTLDEIIIGCVDEFGNLFVYSISESSSNGDRNLKFMRVLEINGSENASSEHHRLIWCPYLPEDDDGSGDTDDSSARLLVLTHNSIAEMWNVDMVVREYGSGPLNAEDITIGRLKIVDHEEPITDASFSPDGTALATASIDGKVKFFQVYMHGDESPRCLHQWCPHDGAPLSSLFFLDNHKDHNPDVQFWKYAVTGSKRNSELKVWSCESWNCLQTIRFDSKDSVFKACLDLSAKFLLLSDIVKKNIYVLQLKETVAEKMRIVSVSEFATPSPFLSMHIIDAGIKKVSDLHTKDENDDDNDDDDVDDDDDTQMFSREATVIELYLVQPKSLQECRIVYDDACQLTNLEGIVAPKALYPEGILSSPSAVAAKATAEAAAVVTTTAATTASATTTTAEAVVASSSASAITSSNGTLTVAANKISLTSPDIMNGEKSKDLIPSGGSSPSREVQDIFGDSDHDLCGDVVVTEENYDENDEDDEEEEEVEIEEDWPLPPSAIKKEIKTPPKIVNKSFENFPNFNNNSSSDNRNNQFDLILRKMNELTTLVQAQRTEMQFLRDEIHLFKTIQQQQQQQFQQQKPDLTKQILDSFRHQETKLINRLDSAIRSEFQRTSTNLIQQAMKTAKTDTVSKDAIVKMTHSKPVIEAIGQSVSASLQPTLQAIFKDIFAAVIIPGFERSCQNLYIQIASAFTKGVKEYEAQLKSHLNALHRKEHETLMKEMKESVNVMTQLTRKAMAREDVLVATIREVVAKEVARSAATTPAAAPAVLATGGVLAPPSPPDIMSAVRGLLSQGRFDEAFQTALSANNLGIVVATCESVNPMQIFSQTPCPLSQQVLLSLIQQLSHNLEEKTDIKHKYLEEAIMNLDSTNLSTKHHMKAILNPLQKQLQAFIINHPNQKITRSMKMLQMATLSLVNNEA